jgi:hypothetical protein
MRPRLASVRLIVEDDVAALEAVEHLIVDGTPASYPITCWFAVRHGLIDSVRVYREGSADVADVADMVGEGGVSPR